MSLAMSHLSPNHAIAVMSLITHVAHLSISLSTEGTHLVEYRRNSSSWVQKEISFQKEIISLSTEGNHLVDYRRNSSSWVQKEITQYRRKSLSTEGNHSVQKEISSQKEIILLSTEGNLVEYRRNSSCLVQKEITQYRRKPLKYPAHDAII